MWSVFFQFTQRLKERQFRHFHNHCVGSSFMISFVSHQDERERKMKNMEERMKEIELSLRNVKLLLKEKVAQLKDQVSLKWSVNWSIQWGLKQSQQWERRNIKSQRQVGWPKYKLGAQWWESFSAKALHHIDSNLQECKDYGNWIFNH